MRALILIVLLAVALLTWGFLIWVVICEPIIWHFRDRRRRRTERRPRGGVSHQAAADLVDFAARRHARADRALHRAGYVKDSGRASSQPGAGERNGARESIAPGAGDLRGMSDGLRES